MSERTKYNMVTARQSMTLAYGYSECFNNASRMSFKNFCIFLNFMQYIDTVFKLSVASERLSGDNNAENK